MEILDRVAAAIVDDVGRLLMVRREHPTLRTLISPGGKREAGESDRQTLIRELREELGVEVVSAALLGVWTEDAALDPGRLVRMAVYRTVIDRTPVAQGEITELHWVDADYPEPMGSVMKKHVIPLLKERDMEPSVGRIVHYVSYGTPGGEYGKECRAAIVTEVNTSDTVGLCVLNPTGQFFNRTVVHHEAEGDGQQEPGGGALNHPGGTWHWPERV